MFVWCPVAAICPDPLQHSHTLDNGYLVIEFHNWCGDAPIYDAQQVETLIYYLTQSQRSGRRGPEGWLHCVAAPQAVT